ncbi:uncharacterized protein PV06_07954 [Exophiala oligosperma]|uniref:FAD-binding domain-containing protein n=1 Tax=Exophiala oligosperma TaxID=215243 RepID=A0A0D2DE84_9EURO|nr:uncharacterized protein PV06_07954 [Exophiala oligosperma]KIW40780.1 hypothetical protein PV06_07954 [Exophiala oligosperma]
MLQIAIAGAGVTGLVTAIAFAQYGHVVTIYERKTEEVFANEGGAAIQLQPNAVRILREWHIDISDVGHESDGMVVRRWSTEETLAYAKPLAGVQFSILRSDFRRSMLAKAFEHGVKVFFNTGISGVDASRPALILGGGAPIPADLVIGADGIGSKVRQSLFPSVRPIVGTDTGFQFQVPLSDLESQAAKALIVQRTPNLTMGPGTATFSGPLFSRQVFDLQLLVREYNFEEDPHPDVFFEYVSDMRYLRRRFRDYGPVTQECLRKGKGAWKWRMSECDAPKWHSENGKVILAGDSCHAMMPYAGQGAGMCIEDAAVLAEFFHNVSADEDHAFRVRARLYQELRQPRTTKTRLRSREMGIAYCLPDGKMQMKRDSALKGMQERKEKLPIKGNFDASPLSNAFDNWLEQYDAIDEAQKALSKVSHHHAMPASKL